MRWNKRSKEWMMYITIKKVKRIIYPPNKTKINILFLTQDILNVNKVFYDLPLIVF